MSDRSDVIDNVEDEEIVNYQSEEFLAEQDKKFEELRLQLQKMKEENQRQMDIIINSLDELMAEKTHIDETLNDIKSMKDFPETNEPVDQQQFNVVDYLAKITGYNELDDIVSSIKSSPQTDGDEQCKTNILKEHEKTNTEIENDVKMSVVEQVSCNEDSASDLETELSKCHSDSEKSEIHKESNTEKDETLYKSDKYSEKIEKD